MKVHQRSSRSFRKVLVTGAAGFIGSSLVDSLLADGVEVVGIDNFDPYYDVERKRRNLRGALQYDAFRFVEGDILDAAHLASVFDQGPFDVVVHLAAKAGVRPSIDDPESYFEVNVRGTMNLLDRLKVSPDTRLVMASSSSVYGNQVEIPFLEGAETSEPVSPYAASKKAGEVMAHAYHQLYGTPMNLLRFFTVYGPRQRPEMAIAKFFDRIASGQTVPMFGDGTTARDYTYIEDIVTGVKQAMAHCAGFEIYNLGNSTPVPLAEMIGAVGRALGRVPMIDQQPEQAGDVTITCADVSKARRMLWYHPSTSLELGLQRYRDWLLQAGELPMPREREA